MSPKEPIVADLAQLEKMSQRISGTPSPARQFAQWKSCMVQAIATLNRFDS